MKIQSILAAIALAIPASALADHRVVVVGRGYSGGKCRVPSYSHCSPSYARYRLSNCYRPYSYYRPGYYASVIPFFSFSYTSTSPRYYPPYAAPAPRYSYDAGSIEVDVQRELRRRGYYRGAIDGDIGPASRAAIRAYQADRGMYPSGRIDSALLRSLGI